MSRANSTIHTPYNPIVFQLYRNANLGFNQHINKIPVNNEISLGQNINWFDDSRNREVDTGPRITGTNTGINTGPRMTGTRRRVLQLPEETQSVNNYSPTRCGEKVLGRRREISDSNFENNMSNNYRTPPIITRNNNY